MGRLTQWFEEQIERYRRTANERPDQRMPANVGGWRPAGEVIAEMESMRDEARRLETADGNSDRLEACPTNGNDTDGDGEGGGEPACLAWLVLGRLSEEEQSLIVALDEQDAEASAKLTDKVADRVEAALDELAEGVTIKLGQCGHCGDIYSGTRRRRYCSDACRNAAWYARQREGGE